MSDVDDLRSRLAERPPGVTEMMPALAYTSEDVLAWERRHVFAGTWT